LQDPSQSKITGCDYTTYVVLHLLQARLQETDVFSFNASEMYIKRKVIHK